MHHNSYKPPLENKNMQVRSVVELQSDMGSLKRGARGVVLKKIDLDNAQVGFIRPDGTQIAISVPIEKLNQM